MDNLSLHNKLKFFEFLNDELSRSELVNFIFNTKELEKELGEEIYTDLILLHQNNKNEIGPLKEHVSKIVPESEFETWKLTELLKRFINEPKKITSILIYFMIYIAVPSTNLEVDLI